MAWELPGRAGSRSAPGTSDAGSGPRLARRLGTADAVVIGLGSMIGAGVFAAFGAAADSAGSGLLLGLAVAAGVAYCNAVASAQLAATYPESGGTYVYGRRQLGDWWGFTAGWGFVVGKTASCAVMALTFASYAVPGPGWAQRCVAVVGVLAPAALNYRGVTRTAFTARILVGITLLVLGVFVVAALTGDGAGAGRLTGWPAGPTGVYGVLQSAGLLFFAFAGYARMATMGEEVRDPSRTLPRAIPLALLITVGVYALVGLSALLAAGPDVLAGASAPLTAALDSAGRGEIAPLLRFGGAAASLGALLALMAGIGRTGLAMARRGDLPGWLSGVHPRFHVPHHAELALTLVVVLLVLTTDLRGALGFSSFAVLVYYGIANAAAFTQSPPHRRWPRWVNAAGMVGCTVLAATLPWRSAALGALLLAAGAAGRWVVLRRRDGTAGRRR